MTKRDAGLVGQFQHSLELELEGCWKSLRLPYVGHGLQSWFWKETVMLLKACFLSPFGRCKTLAALERKHHSSLERVFEVAAERVEGSQLQRVVLKEEVPGAVPKVCSPYS